MRIEEYKIGNQTCYMPKKEKTKIETSVNSQPGARLDFSALISSCINSMLKILSCITIFFEPKDGEAQRSTVDETLGNMQRGLNRFNELQKSIFKGTASVKQGLNGLNSLTTAATHINALADRVDSVRERVCNTWYTVKNSADNVFDKVTDLCDQSRAFFGQGKVGYNQRYTQIKQERKKRLALMKKEIAATRNSSKKSSVTAPCLKIPALGKIQAVIEALGHVQSFANRAENFTQGVYDVCSDVRSTWKRADIGFDTKIATLYGRCKGYFEQVANASAA